jgi:large subunit ribosomal protein L30
MKNDMSKKNIKIKLVKSGIGRKSDQKKTLIGLGLSRVGKIRELEDTPSVRGMVNKVSHLVKII